MSIENRFQNVPPQGEEHEKKEASPAIEQNVDSQLLKDASASAMTARDTPDGVIFKDVITGNYTRLDQGHGWQDYSNSSTEEDWQAGKETREAAISVYTYMLRGWGHIE